MGRKRGRCCSAICWCSSWISRPGCTSTSLLLPLLQAPQTFRPSRQRDTTSVTLDNTFSPKGGQQTCSYSTTCLPTWWKIGKASFLPFKSRIHPVLKPGESRFAHVESRSSSISIDVRTDWNVPTSAYYERFGIVDYSIPTTLEGIHPS